MTRTRKIMLAIGGSLLTIVLSFCGYNSWSEWHYKRYGGYEAAGIDPIPGAELVSFKYEDSGFLPDFDATWVYKIPAEYTDKLYKDCSARHYETGVFPEYGKDGKELIGPKKPGCHRGVERHHGVVSIEFSGDQLTVQDTYGF